MLPLEPLGLLLEFALKLLVFHFNLNAEVVVEGAFVQILRYVIIELRYLSQELLSVIVHSVEVVKLVLNHLDFLLQFLFLICQNLL